MATASMTAQRSLFTEIRSKLILTEMESLRFGILDVDGDLVLDGERASTSESRSRWTIGVNDPTATVMASMILGLSLSTL